MRTYNTLIRAALGIALCLVVLGAYVRLSDAGLGCPDWPGCYGHLLGVPETAAAIDRANALYPQRGVETDKAWKEMAHRYLAGIFGGLVLLVAGIAMRNRRAAKQPVVLPFVLLLVTLFQGLLGMWTVTWLLNPAVVTMHLLGGMTILAILWWLVLTSAAPREPEFFAGAASSFRMAVLVTAVLVLQIFLGGWTSSNYAALACADFPTCQQQWWPVSIDFGAVFFEWYEHNVTYEFGSLESTTRVAIHWLHRLGALVITIFVTAFLLRLLMQKPPGSVKAIAGISFFLLIAQIMLGISNVVYALPKAVAVAHNGFAALLLLAMITMMYYLKSCAESKVETVPCN